MKPPWDLVLTFFVGVASGWVANWLWHKYSRWRMPKGSYLISRYTNGVFEFEGRSASATLAKDVVEHIFKEAQQAKFGAVPTTQAPVSTPARTPRTPVAPTVVTKDATDITSNSATLNGEIHDGGTVNSGTISYQLGLSPGNYTSEYPLARRWVTIIWGNTSNNSNGSYSDWPFTISGLRPSTTYYFRMKATGDGAGYGVEKSFATGPNPVTQLCPIPSVH
jgi:hypothetical protein